MPHTTAHRRSPSASRVTRGPIAATLGAATAGLLSLAAFAPMASAAAPETLLDSSRQWGPAATSTIHPGVVTVTEGAGSCTGNFVFTDAKKNVYLGQAAHCSGTGEATETNGCESASLPLGTPVALGVSGVTGTVAYSSWLTMQDRGETDVDACTHNDFALIKIPADAIAKVNPSIPVFGGPMGINTTGTQVGDSVTSYGNSPLRQGLAAFSPKQGTSIGDVGNGWAHQVYTLTPGIPGDSGSAFLDSEGRALGTLSTLVFAPQPLSNQVSDISRQLAYARDHGIKGLRLVEGTEPFAASPLGL
ncbi:MAG: serine protease [Sporichthyaceae bacterium]